MNCVYTNQINADMDVSGLQLPSDFCPKTYQELFDRFIENLKVRLPAGYSTFVISESEPSPQDRDKAWLKYDSSGCKVVGWFLWNGRTWVQISNRIYYAEDTSSTANLISIIETNPYFDTLGAEEILIVKSNTYNTGASQIKIRTQDNKPIKKYGGQELIGYEFKKGQYLIFTYNSENDYYELLNPIPVNSITEDLPNASFELDTNSDSIPDEWEVVKSEDATGVMTSDDQFSGKFSFKAAVTRTNDYVSLITKNYVEVNEWQPICLYWALKSTVADVIVEVNWYWYQISQYGEIIQLATPDNKTTIFYSNTNLSATWKLYKSATIPPLGAKYAKLEFNVKYNTSGGYVLIDAVRLARNEWSTRLEIPLKKPLDNSYPEYLPTYKFVFPENVTAFRITMVSNGAPAFVFSGQVYCGAGGAYLEKTIRRIKEDRTYYFKYTNQYVKFFAERTDTSPICYVTHARNLSNQSYVGEAFDGDININGTLPEWATLQQDRCAGGSYISLKGYSPVNCTGEDNALGYGAGGSYASADGSVVSPGAYGIIIIEF